MKTATTLIGILLASITFAQNTSKSENLNSTPVSPRVETSANTNSIPDAQVIRTGSGTNYTYQFVSNRNLSAEQADRWVDRFPQVYTDLIGITIDPQTQQVEIVLPANHNPADFDSMIQRFGYASYQLTN